MHDYIPRKACGFPACDGPEISNKQNGEIA
jgi:hypothetical protein